MPVLGKFYTTQELQELSKQWTKSGEPVSRQYIMILRADAGFCRAAKGLYFAESVEAFLESKGIKVNELETIEYKQPDG